MTSMAEKVITDFAQQAPDAPIAQAAVAAVDTVEAPTPESIMNDIETIITIARELRVKLAGVHPTIINILKALF